MLSTGNIIIFDNGRTRGYSRVIEVDPTSGEVVWQYPRKPDPNFFTAERGYAQRLANGNTLITESDKGHTFEVTMAGQIVWEFWNPELEEGKRKSIYRMMKLKDPSMLFPES